MKIYRLPLQAPHDYEAAGKALQSELGCWNYHETRERPLHLNAKSPIKIYVLNGHGVLNRLHMVEAGMVIEAPAGTALTFTGSETMKMRSCWPENLVVCERLKSLWASVTGPNNDAYPPVGSNQVYFCTKPGPLFGKLFTQGSRPTVVNVRDLLSFTFHGLEPDSEPMKNARAAVQIAEHLNDLRTEELVEKRNGRWCRVSPASKEHLTLNEAGCDDTVVELLLTHLWADPNPLCRWMNSAPHFKKYYTVPYLHLPGKKVSSEFQRRWGVMGVCSGRHQTLPVRDVLVTIDNKELVWRCEAARELARWKYRVNGSSVKFQLVEVYD